MTEPKSIPMLVPLVSVVIPSYNHAEYVQQCIQSVIDQDYRNIELIVIDDGSSDRSVQVIESMVEACMQRFVRYEFRSRPNRGLPATMNEALEWAQGRYFSYVSSDDLMLPGKTARLVDAIKDRPDLAGVFCGAETINEITSTDSNRSVQVVTYCGFAEIFLHSKSLVASSMLLDRASMQSVGGYDENVFFEDWYMWLKLTEGGSRLMVLPEILVKYRIHSENMSKNIVRMQDARIRIAGTYNQHKLYPQVMANIYAASALEYSEVSRSDTFHYLVKSLVFSRKVVFSHNFSYALVKALVPKAVLDFIKRIFH